jgi:hypothetical protein
LLACVRGDFGELLFAEAVGRGRLGSAGRLRVVRGGAAEAGYPTGFAGERLDVEKDDGVDDGGEGERKEDPEVVEVESKILVGRVDPTLYTRRSDWPRTCISV